MSEKPIIALTRPWTDGAMAALAKDYRIQMVTDGFLVAALDGAEAFCPVFFETVDAALIAALPDTVKIIASLGVGVDHIDLAAATEKGLVVTNTPDVVSDDTADLAIGLMIAALRGFTSGEAMLRAGQWRGASMQGLIGRKVSGKTLGLVGMGRIAEKVARRAGGFDMKILYFSRTRKPELEKELGLISASSLEELVGKADVISLHTPLNGQTRHMIDADMLAKFKPGSFLINTARGGLADEAALAEALEKGSLGGAGLDVYEFEPRVTKGLQAFDNVTLLPHLGTATLETRTAMGLRVKENLDSFFQTGQAKDRVI